MVLINLNSYLHHGLMCLYLTHDVDVLKRYIEMYETGTRTEVQSAISLAVAQGPSSLIEMCVNEHLCVFSF